MVAENYLAFIFINFFLTFHVIVVTSDKQPKEKPSHGRYSSFPVFESQFLLLFLLFQPSPQSKPTSATATMQSKGQRFLSQFKISTPAEKKNTSSGISQQKKKKKCHCVVGDRTSIAQRHDTLRRIHKEGRRWTKETKGQINVQF